MSLEYVKTIDPEFTEIIKKQSQNIKMGSQPLIGKLPTDIKKIVGDVLHSFDIYYRNSFADMFPRRELVRIKFAINALEEYELIIEAILEKLSVNYKIKEITYLEDGKNNMILIWL